MWYLCSDCKTPFHPDEMKRTTEYRGECFGFPSYETMGCCPKCDSTDIGEADDIEVYEALVYSWAKRNPTTSVIPTLLSKAGREEFLDEYNLDCTPEDMEHVDQSICRRIAKTTRTRDI